MGDFLTLFGDIELQETRRTYWNDTRIKIENDETLKKGVLAIEEYVKDKKVSKVNLIANIIVALLTLFVFKFNLIAFAIAFILFDMICIPIDKFLFEKKIKNTYLEYTKDELNQIIETFKDFWACEDESDGIAYIWLKELEIIKEKKEKEEEIQEKLGKYTTRIKGEDTNVETPVLSEKDNDRFLTLYNKVNDIYSSFSTKEDKDAFEPCLNACSIFKEKQVGENRLMYSTSFIKQFLNFLEEFADDMVIWGTITDTQKEVHIKGMKVATTAFENWTKSSIEKMEQDAVSGLRVSINTLTDMLEEDVKKQKE